MDKRKRTSIEELMKRLKQAAANLSGAPNASDPPHPEQEKQSDQPKAAKPSFQQIPRKEPDQPSAPAQNTNSTETGSAKLRKLNYVEAMQFTSHEECRRFTQMPPIDHEDLLTCNVDELFSRLFDPKLS